LIQEHEMQELKLNFILNHILSIPSKRCRSCFTKCHELHPKIWDL